MREITSHKVNGLNNAIQIVASEEVGAGGAPFLYVIRLGNVERIVRFQNGPTDQGDFNGISNEALLAIVEDRLQQFQKGPFSCRENSIALTKLQEATMWLHRRTREREQRGVEGTAKV